MARLPLPEGEGKVPFNAKVDPQKLLKLRKIAFRRSVIKCEKYSHADFLEENIEKTKMPRKPTEAELAAYRERYPRADHTEPA